MKRKEGIMKYLIDILKGVVIGVANAIPGVSGGTMMAGGAVGGVAAGLLGAKAYVMGYSNVLALPIFQNTIVAMSIAIVTAIVVAAVVTYVLGFEEKN